MYITRTIEPLISRLSKEYPAILLTGSRQTGKTTLLKNISKTQDPNRNYVSLDGLRERELAKSDPKMFFQIYKPPVLIDEVQYAPELFPYIKILIDETHRPGDFWLTGSQLFKLMKGVHESLAGRIALLHLTPLSQTELYGGVREPFSTNLEKLIAKESKLEPVSTPEIYQRIFLGGMPALATGEYTDANIFYSSYIGTYLIRDVEELSGTISSLKFLKFITAVAARASQMVNYKNIADECDLDQATVKAWLLILETLGIIFYLRPFSNNALSRTVKTPKLYFYDTGLVCYLTKWSSPETAMNGAMNGPLLENYAVAEVIKSYLNAGFEPFVYYYRDKDDNEIDLIIESDGYLFPIEIKKTASPDSHLTKAFRVLDKAPLQRGTGSILCMADKISGLGNDVLIVPISLI
jgi:predicted AAA+ superfamily ATPase